MSANPVRWRATTNGFNFDGLSAGDAMPTNWLGTDVRAAETGVFTLGPEPIIGPQRIRLLTLSQPTRSLTVATDGVRPFAVLADAEASNGSP
jgi:general secretion pathway protein H